MLQHLLAALLPMYSFRLTRMMHSSLPPTKGAAQSGGTKRRHKAATAAHEMKEPTVPALLSLGRGRACGRAGMNQYSSHAEKEPRSASERGSRDKRRVSFSFADAGTRSSAYAAPGPFSRRARNHLHVPPVNREAARTYYLPPAKKKTCICSGGCRVLNGLRDANAPVTRKRHEWGPFIATLHLKDEA